MGSWADFRRPMSGRMDVVNRGGSHSSYGYIRWSRLSGMSDVADASCG